MTGHECSPAVARDVRLGLRANLPQFSLLVVVNAFVGAMVGMERSILPAIAEQEFHLAARAAILSFIVVFGVTKALTNYVAGRLSDRFGRKRRPRGRLARRGSGAVPADVGADVELDPGRQRPARRQPGAHLVDDGHHEDRSRRARAQRGLAMGLNEFAGYLAVAASALATGWIAAQPTACGPQPFYLGVGFVAVGSGALGAGSCARPRHHVAHESASLGGAAAGRPCRRSARSSGAPRSRDRNLSSVSQAGLVNNLNDGMAWGLFPLVFAAAGMNLRPDRHPRRHLPGHVGHGASSSPARSRTASGRKRLIVWGMWVQAVGIVAIVGCRARFAGFALGAVLLGLGTAMVYPTLLAAIGDVAHPTWRASSVGVYRLWRDLGYAVGALLAGLVADAFGLSTALWTVAALTFASGLVAAIRMTETLLQPAHAVQERRSDA